MQVETYCATTATLLTSASLSKSSVAPSATTSTETITMAMTGVPKRAERRSRMRGRNASCAKVST